MTDIEARRAMDGIRLLAEQLDPMVEAILESHGFRFMAMGATPLGASASFGSGSASERAWTLTIHQEGDGRGRVMLEEGTNGDGDGTDAVVPALSLSILTGGRNRRSLAEAVGLAASFAALSAEADEIRHLSAEADEIRHLSAEADEPVPIAPETGAAPA